MDLVVDVEVVLPHAVRIRDVVLARRVRIEAVLGGVIEDRVQEGARVKERDRDLAAFRYINYRTKLLVLAHQYGWS
jgi:hypothetical protein